ncbi:DUF4314 domain-containing protein [Nonomuraea sp. NPDC050328]|uniref:DUF4314 domain-containing protein n=1 Tax=Nonomuraea sp. NPDC050328 TaxID=3364361 RepID=UPI00378F8139
MELNDFAPGDRVELVATADRYTGLQPGDQGTVIHVEQMGGVAVRWDSGAVLGMLPDQGDDIRRTGRRADA